MLTAVAVVVFVVLCSILCLMTKIPAESYSDILNTLIRYLGAQSVVVHSYAAACIDRLLNVRDDGVRRLDKQKLVAVLEPLMGSLFGIVFLHDREENEYVMRCCVAVILGFLSRSSYCTLILIRLLGILKVTSIVEDGVAPFAPIMLERLKAILSVVAKNPRVPGFNRYLFETIVAMVRNLPGEVEGFEGALFPTFQEMLQADVQGLSWCLFFSPFFSSLVFFYSSSQNSTLMSSKPCRCCWS